MKALSRIVLSDFRQRTRSYAFLITLAVSLFAAYMFVPPAEAAYTTLRIGNYTGVLNSAWIGYLTAMLAAVFIPMVGFYLVNGGVKNDMDTGVGMIIATTAISNFQYLLAKAISNFLVLLSITASVFVMAVLLFFFRSGQYPFEISQFLVPYLLITLPAILLTAAFAVVGEVFLYRYTIVMNVGYFFLFCFFLSQQSNAHSLFNVFGSRRVTESMQSVLVTHTAQKDLAVSMGFIVGHKDKIRFFTFEGISWPVSAVAGRIILCCIAMVLVWIAARFFHRFDVRQITKVKKKNKFAENFAQIKLSRDIKLSELPPVTRSYGVIPFVKTELLMLLRKGPKWLWLINLAGICALVFAPLLIAHQAILPILWFFQVGRWSDLATKEKTSRLHYFTYASYKPLARLLPAQLLAGCIVAWVLAAPLMVRYFIDGQVMPVLSIFIGAACIVLFAVVVGILSGGKKLFEILFFLFTYANIEKVPFADYYGGINHGLNYILVISLGFAVLVIGCFSLKKMEMSRL